MPPVQAHAIEGLRVGGLAVYPVAVAEYQQRLVDRADLQAYRTGAGVGRIMRISVARDEHFRTKLGRGQVQQTAGLGSSQFPELLVHEQHGRAANVDQREHRHAQHVAALPTVGTSQHSQVERLDGLHGYPVAWSTATSRLAGSTRTWMVLPALKSARCSGDSGTLSVRERAGVALVAATSRSSSTMK